jgi:hypothetical protein
MPELPLKQAIFSDSFKQHIQRQRPGYQANAVFIGLQTKGADKTQENLFFRGSKAAKMGDLLPKLPGIRFVEAKRLVVKLQFEQVDHAVPPVKEQIDLDAGVLVGSGMVVTQRVRMDAGNAHRFFDLRDVFQANAFKSVAAPGGKLGCLAKVLPGACALLL